MIFKEYILFYREKLEKEAALLQTKKSDEQETEEGRNDKRNNENLYLCP